MPEKNAVLVVGTTSRLVDFQFALQGPALPIVSDYRYLVLPRRYSKHRRIIILKRVPANSTNPLRGPKSMTKMLDVAAACSRLMCWFPG